MGESGGIKAMNLTNLQLELQDIEKHIASLQIKIEQMKPAVEKVTEDNYAQIAQIAKLFPIKRTALEAADRVLQKEYIVSLAYFFLTSGNKIYDKLLYICRISMGCKLEMTPEDIYKGCLDFEKNEMDKICVELAKYKYSYIVDALIIANITRNPENRDLTVVTDIALLLGCNKEELRVVALMAKCILVANYDLLKNMSFSTQPCLSRQLNGLLPKEWLVAQRLFLERILITSKKIKKDDGTLKDNKPTNIPWIRSGNDVNITETDIMSDNMDLCEITDKVKNESMVKRGNHIITYLKKIKTKEKINIGIAGHITEVMGMNKIEKKSQILEAPYNGKVYFKEILKKDESAEIENTYLDVYLVSFFDDYADFCKWHELEN